MDRPALETRSAAFGVAVARLCEQVCGLPTGRGPANQLLDCATAVGANYRASARARSRREFVAKLGIVAEEADEAVYWLQFLERTARGEPAVVANLLQEATELRAIFAASYRTARARLRRPPEGRGSKT